MQERKTPDFNDYRSMMKTVRTPEHVRAETLRAAERTEAQHASERAERTYSTNRRPAPKRATWKPLAAAACVAAVVGLGALGVTFGLPLLGNQPATSPDATPAAPSGNFFALAAYAAENPEGEPGKTTELGLRYFLPSGYSGSEVNMLTGEKYPDLDWITHKFLFDVTCEGENIQSIEYAIEGDGLYFWMYDEEEFLRAHGVYGDDDPAVEEGWTETIASSFSIDYANQDMIENRISCRLCVPIQLEGKAKELDAQIRTNDGISENSELWEEFSNTVLVDAAQKLAQSQLTVTATFTDGSTQTKHYVIAPVEDFTSAYAVYQNALAEAGDIKDLEAPALFTITEVEAS